MSGYFKINMAVFVFFSTLFVLTCHVLTDMVRLIEGKIMQKMTGRFESSRAGVTEGKITVNV